MSKDKDRKKFKETGFYRFLEKAAQVAPAAGSAVLDLASGDIKGAINHVREALGQKVDDPQAQQLLAEMQKYEMQWIKEVAEIEVRDRETARAMRNEFTRAGKTDWERVVVNFAAVIGWAAMIWYVLTQVLPQDNKEIIIHIIGVMEGIVLGIYAFHNGSSYGSRLKDMISRKDG